MNNKVIEIKKIFPINEQECFYVHLKSNDWDYSIFGLVNLKLNNEVIQMKYVGYANVNGNSVLKLIPMQLSFLESKELIESNSQETYLER